MPVFGHAVVGLGVAIEGMPREGIPRRGWLWLPAIVALSYLPDIIGHSLCQIGVDRWREIGHSVFVSIPLAGAVSLLLAAVFRLTVRRTLIISSISLLLHLLPDILTGSRHMFFWPLSGRSRGFGLSEEKIAIVPELLVFCGLFFGYLHFRWWNDPGRRGELRDRLLAIRAGGLGLTFVLTGGIVGAVAFFYGMGMLRYAQHARAWEMANRKDYAGAMAMIEKSQRWPAGGRAGRLDYLRAEIASQQGDRAAKERYLLRSYAADPGYFWCVADLAYFYASGPEPLAVRRERAAPYLRTLEERFRDLPEYPARRSGLVRKLGLTASGPVSLPG